MPYRTDRDAWCLKMAALVAERATCTRRRVGCVLTNSLGHILSTGYNGPPRGFQHCTPDEPCSGASLPSGTGLELCEAVHAEQNALLQCKDVELIASCYVTTAPCVTCVKLLLNTSCQCIVFSEAYPQMYKAHELWVVKGGRFWVWPPGVDHATVAT
jgi:dCMP deaminase